MCAGVCSTECTALNAEFPAVMLAVEARYMRRSIRRAIAVTAASTHQYGGQAVGVPAFGVPAFGGSNGAAYAPAAAPLYAPSPPAAPYTGTQVAPAPQTGKEPESYFDKLQADLAAEVAATPQYSSPQYSGPQYTRAPDL